MLKEKKIKFYKMQGCGNDFVIINQAVELTIEQIKLICDRNYGIGCDQLIVLTELADNTLQVKIYNKDGTIAYSCGNGLRCVGLLMKILYKKNKLNIEIAGGNKIQTEVVKLYDRTAGQVYVDLGKYKLSEREEGDIIEIGNRHLVIEVDNIRNADMGYGEYLSKKFDLNVSFFEHNNCQAKALVYERGVGMTRACGSAAAAIHIASSNDLRPTEVVFDNSDEKITAGDVNKMTSYIVADAKLVFKGNFYL
jgi:diaminopimelate epimerase